VFGPELEEYLTLAFDPLIAALVLRRWGFRMLPIGLTWLGVTLASLAGAGILGMIAGAVLLPTNAGPAMWAPVFVVCLAAFFAPRAIVLRRVSTSSAHRTAGAPPLGWGVCSAVAVGAFLAAMLLAAAIGMALKRA
jgi:hypothetical protein